jgi:hypothetical protein
MYISGTILKSTPMVQIDGEFIDGYNVSVTCYDITQTEVKALTLSCGNLSINDGIQATDSHAPLLRLTIILDVADDEVTCFCSNNITGDISSITRTIDYCKY